MEKLKPLTLSTEDSDGKKAPTELIGMKLAHTGNGRIYKITAVCWLGETDKWGFTHREDDNPNAVNICRPLSHLEGNRSNGEKRYVILKPYKMQDNTGLATPFFVTHKDTQV